MLVWNWLHATCISFIWAIVYDTDRREILHDGTYRSWTDLLPFWGGTPGDPQIRNFRPTFWPLWPI